uniref:Uncharacterized protein LOC105644387 isoform X2 n=1 Tax=Rhizophora mucronata TaxID=61149 RepID=A0A2P2MTZ6_RHIMU
MLLCLSILEMLDSVTSNLSSRRQPVGRSNFVSKAGTTSSSPFDCFSEISTWEITSPFEFVGFKLEAEGIFCSLWMFVSDINPFVSLEPLRIGKDDP